jgi:sulfur-oxidizing protein SoxX
MQRGCIWRHGPRGGIDRPEAWSWLTAAGHILAAMVFTAISSGAHALECKPKTAGYFQQMAAFANKSLSPGDLVGITQSLTGAIGDPARGRLVMIDKEKGNCLACHRVPALGEEPTHGDLGPNLNGVSARFTEAQLRQIIVDPKVLFPNTIMPAFHISPEFQRVPRSLAANTVLPPGDVEDVIAFLKNLR